MRKKNKNIFHNVILPQILKNQLKLNRYDGHNMLNCELSVPIKIFSLHWELRFRNPGPISEKRKSGRPAKAKQALIVHAEIVVALTLYSLASFEVINNN
ncbi:hypothetical protein BpHYR1_010243 [Brachionus plicatilis]|uniref:Uncharacterized protein n=1 Tax=Brachionus plicatilis TaxID=10195 RepID=A0A3M7R110_BRAPC|nr:hypothetical protein BpHYR1_010243 [Brachionus plicatilis]